MKTWTILIASACSLGVDKVYSCLADQAIQKAKSAAISQSPTVSTSEVRLTILGDNAVAGPGVNAVWGFACLVEAHGHTILFDTGADPAVLKHNLTTLKIAPARIEAIVFSHYHSDHTLGAPGLGTLAGVRAYIPRSFASHPSEAATLRSAGLTLVPVTRETPLFEVISVTEPLSYEIRLPAANPKAKPADEGWEQALTIDTPKGFIVIPGCSHPGILKMLEQVQRQTGRPPYLVIGGFHLLGRSETGLRQLAMAMQAMGVTYVSATHCSDELAAHAFRSTFGKHYISAGVGAVIECPFLEIDKDDPRS